MSVKIVVGMMIFDYVTGIIGAAMEQKLDSRVGMKGIAKKLMMCIQIAAGYIIGLYIHSPAIYHMLVCFFIANEGISILENSSRVGVPVPESVKKFLIQLKESTEEGGIEDGNRHEPSGTHPGKNP